MKDPSQEVSGKAQSPWRWLILFLGCVMMIGPYYCFDIPAALKTQLKNHMGNPDDYEVKFNLLYTLYASPNVILPFFGGYLVDRLGVKTCLLLFASSITLGQIIFSLGVGAKSWALMFLGCVVMGLGGESYTVANSALLSEWFKGAELAFAFGVNLSIAKLGSVINDISSPRLADRVNIVFASWFGVILCAVAILSIILVIPVDLLVEQQIRGNARHYHLLPGSTTAVADSPPPTPKANASNEAAATSYSQLHVHDAEEHHIPLADQQHHQPSSLAGCRDIYNIPRIFWILLISIFAIYGCVLPFNNISSSFLLERDYFRSTSSACALQYPMQCPSDSNQPNSACPTSQWYQPPIPLNYTAAYPTLSTNDIDCTDDYWQDGCATSEYCDRLIHAESVASVVMAIPYIISAVLSPVFGYFIDRIGCRAIIATISPAILIFVHVCLAVTSWTPIALLVGQGLAYTGFASVLWPSIPIIVEERVTGVAFGIAMSVNNIASAVIPVIAAQIYTNSNDHYIPNVEYLFVSLAALGLIMGLIMNWYDHHHGHVLNGPLFGAAATSTPLITDNSK